MSTHRLIFALLYGIFEKKSAVVNDENYYLCVFKNQNNGSEYPNYCTELNQLCPSQYNENGVEYELYGSQIFNSGLECQKYRNQTMEASLYCEYHYKDDNDNDKYPNYCLPSYSGQVCPDIHEMYGCSLRYEPIWFDNQTSCDKFRNRSIPLAQYMMYQINGFANFNDHVTFKLRFRWILLIGCMLMILFGILLIWRYSRYCHNSNDIHDHQIAFQEPNRDVRIPINENEEREDYEESEDDEITATVTGSIYDDSTTSASSSRYGSYSHRDSKSVIGIQQNDIPNGNDPK